MRHDDIGASCSTSENHCITCADEGITMRVLRADEMQAVCLDDDGFEHDVAVDLVGPVTAGDRVLVHAGIAIAHTEDAR